MMTFKKMVELYVSYGCDSDTWQMFYNMRNHNLISHELWMKFSTHCKGWHIEGNEIYDMDNDDKVVYKTDADGFFKKV